MTRTTYYLYEFSNGYVKHMSPREAWEYAKTNEVRITRDGLDNAARSIKMTKDGFKTGFNPGMGCEVTGRRHYERLLKEKGLVEVGKDYISPKDKETEYFDHETCKELSKAGASDNAIKKAKED